MNILTYLATDPACPPARRALAYIITPMQGAKGKWSDDFLPVRFSASTVEEARARAQEHWDAAMEKEASKKPHWKKRPTVVDVPVAQTAAEYDDVI